MPFLFQAKSYFSYWLDAVDEHSLHSPYLFDFFLQVLKPKASNEYAYIERQRHALLKNSASIIVQDLGGGSKFFKTKTRAVKDIARTSLSPAKYAQLYARIIKHIHAKVVIELGTSFGINTQYLAADESAQVFTFEGAPEIAGVARQNFEEAPYTNITLIEGNIDHTLPQFLLTAPTIDVAFMDANHRYEPTLNYYTMLAKHMTSEGIIIVDDIHQSPGMHDAWNELKSRSEIGGSIDLYRCGILFFNQALSRQHMIVQY